MIATKARRVLGKTCLIGAAAALAAGIAPWHASAQSSLDDDHPTRLLRRLRLCRALGKRRDLIVLFTGHSPRSYSAGERPSNPAVTAPAQSFLSAASNLPPSTIPAVTNLPPAEEHTVTIESPEARYIFTSLGGGIKLIELKKYPQRVR